MVDTSKDAGIIQVLAERMESQRLPAILAIKEKVDRGEILSDYNIRFLEQVLQDAQSLKPLVERHPEWQPLVAKIVHLYKQVTEVALENEKSNMNNH